MKEISFFDSVKRTCYSARWFFLLVGIFWFAAGLSCMLFEKKEIHLYMNQYHSDWLDFTFRYITFLGDGWMAVLLAISFVLFDKKKHALGFGFSFVFSALLVQFLKRFVFEHLGRPYAVMPELISPIEGVVFHQDHSFPSGHTTMAFMMAIYVMLRFRFSAVWMFCFAFFAAVSRVYLSQHFLIDILAGSFIGVIFSLFGFTYITTYLKKDSWQQRLHFNLKRKS